MSSTISTKDVCVSPCGIQIPRLRVLNPLLRLEACGVWMPDCFAGGTAKTSRLPKAAMRHKSAQLKLGAQHCPAARYLDLRVAVVATYFAYRPSLSPTDPFTSQDGQVQRLQWSQVSLPRKLRGEVLAPGPADVSSCNASGDRATSSAIGLQLAE
ncbi:hypothetical protein EK21DRAFT_89790 [Setomelanomma holmii]|uniref:Uncharacterized protein n=1 Tax=Setomelanomma holmii TaxID=210430 RepID=A0A9P4LL28_9PLEO|nr:hypothetical protein EK21DRAFT_89790 [Setomelanomma holmii]